MKFGKLLSGVILSCSIVAGVQAATFAPGPGIALDAGDVLGTSFVLPDELIWEFSTTTGLVLELTTYDVDTTTDAEFDGTIGGLRTAAGVGVETDAASASCPGRIPGGDCFILRPTGSTRAGNQPGTVLFATLAPGDYILELDDVNTTPETGLVEFTVSAVPVPAAGVLFGSAMLGAAFLRRRKLQNTLGLPKAGA